MASDAMRGRPAGADGFTLIELMIVVVIIAILASIAVPSYQNSVRKSRRTDAKVMVSSTAQELERCLTQFGRYDDAGCRIQNGTTYNSPEGYYSVAVAIPDPATPTIVNSYRLTATPTGAQTKDSACAAFTLNNLGVKGASDASNTATNDCW